MAKEASVIHAAVRSKNLGILERVMKELPDSIDSQNEKGWKPLSYAASEGCIEEVRFYLNNFPHSAKKVDRDGSLPIQKALGAGHIQILNLLVKFMNRSELPSFLLERNIDGDTALHLALMGKCEDVALNFIELAPLYWAIERGYNNMVRRIFQLIPGTRIDSSIKKSLLRATKASVVHAAGITMGNDEEPPQKTIAAAVDLDYYLGSGDGPGIVITPVKLRGASNYDEWAKASLDESGTTGPETVSSPAGDTAGVSPPTVRYLLNNFPDSAKKCDRDGSSPIHKAVGAGHVHIVDEFISSCPSTINDVDKIGQSILHIAVKYNKADVFAYLRRRHDIQKMFKLKDNEGTTSMDLVRKLGNF
ncbi:protein ACCELERATED CELL DEATH 6-like [Spinacia oleracea]|uniref:Protein ACCELERATED CELL DEATH 6-like n=1 Tax=Spinacia oleracea TaxID=3562 RepID=A0ABM3RP88_SPIOL|nr:protein ACCELERATED CELL DEATH 6-like [Spinacia oleracea]